MKVHDAIWGALLLLSGAALLVHVQGFPSMPGQKVGPGLFPGVLGAGLAACGALLLVRGWRARSMRSSHGGAASTAWLARPDWSRSPRAVLGAVTLVAVNALYLVAGDRLGFVLTGIVYLGALMRVLGVPWTRVVPLSILLTLAIHFCFYKLLRVPLPWGLLQPIAW